MRRGDLIPLDAGTIREGRYVKTLLSGVVALDPPTGGGRVYIYAAWIIPLDDA